MHRKNIFLLLFFFLALSFVCAHDNHYYDIHDDFEDDYYWASDYYHSDDYYRTSSLTYRYNTYNYGDEFDNFDEYNDYLFRKNHPWLASYYGRKSGREGSRNYDKYSRSFEHGGIRSNSVYYSPVVNKEVVRSCYVVPPSNSLFYIKC